MPAESERPPYSNGDSGRTRVRDAEMAPGTAHRSAREDMTELPHSVMKSQSQPMSQVPKLTSNLPTSFSPSTTNSAVSSRESSPTRTSRTFNSSTTSRVHSQSRRSSQDRNSPTRSSSNSNSSGIPIQSFTSSPVLRAAAQLNNAPIFSPPPAPDPPANVLGPEKPNMPSWTGNRRTEQDSTPPNTSLKRIALPPPEEHGMVERSTPRVVTRGASGQGPSLETVEEMASNPSTPSSDTALKPVTPEDSRLRTIEEDLTPRASKQFIDSGSESGDTRSSEMTEEGRPQATEGTKPTRTLMPQRSTTSLSAGARGKPADGSVRNMIVETETVSSIPQVSLGVGAGERGNTGRIEQGTLKNKKSTDTVRAPVARSNPQKRKRRPNALQTGPTSSKADFFEAKVASAVDEADVSDSDETFVYESNPIDYPPRRYHSRTPSATSMASQVDQLAGRSRLRDGAHNLTVRRSMKFTNNTYNSSLDGEAMEADGRSASRVDGSGTITPRHHIAHHNRTGEHRNSIFDTESVFNQPQSQKSPRHFISGPRHHSRNTTTQSSPNYKTMNKSKKAGDIYGYDFDAEGADDERTPLVRPPRSSRSDRNSRRPGGSSRQIEYIAQRERGYFSQFGSCVVIIMLFLMIAGGATSFFIAATKSLLDVQIVAIQNVLASEQEIMLDLNVSAINPNIFPVTIDVAELNIFARSQHVGTDKLWRDHGSDELAGFPRVKESRRRWQFSQIVRCLGNMDCVEEAGHSKSKKPEHSEDGIDEGTDPIKDPDHDIQTMLLGRVMTFDSPLSFPASPWSGDAATSKGQIRLPQPGNKTEEGGTERWERVLQHPFELIVRGVIKYQIPLSSRYLSAPISSSVKYVPDDEIHEPNTPSSNETAHINDIETPSSSEPLRLADPDPQPELRSGLFKRQFTA
ncbi:hypothetical protein N7466_009308 [Penicillium verhagenii]|uniref:uncharacterized protein n=1 Tax=Penicillium verhagenii TaxID=1562060 RepID=UPI002544ED0B|nr:uncharacterized protein N7466_009308 [Penicillium verhagenii]KAJ5920982.1 hypothetical protein N7466_009308 [Penicillium verhagenii]